MTTVTDLIHDVIGYLVTQCQSNAALGAATPPVLVVDGSGLVGEVTTTDQLRLWIGYDALSGSPGSGTAVQVWPFLGASGNYRQEEGDITCTAEAWDGTNTLSGVRAQCKAIVGAVEIMLRGAPTTGPGDSSMGNLVQWSEVKNFSWTQELSDTGASAMCVFHVTYMARLPA